MQRLHLRLTPKNPDGISRLEIHNENRLIETITLYDYEREYLLKCYNESLYKHVSREVTLVTLDIIVRIQFLNSPHHDQMRAIGTLYLRSPYTPTNIKPIVYSDIESTPTVYHIIPLKLSIEDKFYGYQIPVDLLEY